MEGELGVLPHYLTMNRYITVTHDSHVQVWRTPNRLVSMFCIASDVYGGTSQRGFRHLLGSELQERYIGTELYIGLGEVDHKHVSE